MDSIEPTIAGKSHTSALQRIAALLAASALVSSLPAHAAAAQSAPANAAAPQDASATPQPDPASGGIAEIVVTAQKRSENAQNVPVTITSLSAAMLSATGVLDTTNLKEVTPGLQYNTNLGGFGQPRIRGIGSTATGPGIENPVATYVDGVYLSSANGAIMSLNDIAQVDVLKGPQGTLFGRNATGGVIQVTTRDPGPDLHAEANASYGNYKTWHGDAYVSGGLAPNLTASVAGTYTDQDKGYGINLANGEQVGQSRNGGVRAKLVWQPDSATKVTLSADYGEMKGANPVIGTASDWFLSGYAQPGGYHDLDSNVQPYLHTQSGGGSLTIKHDFGAVEFSSITAYRNAFFHTIIDADQTPLSLLTVDITQRDKQFSEEMQIASKGGGPFKWVAGLFYMNYKGLTDPGSTSGSFVCPYGDAYCSSAASTGYDDALLRSYAGFAQGSYKLDDRTDLTIGGRFTLDERSLHDWSTYSIGSGPAYPANDATASKHYPKATWRVALDHRFSRELMMFATYNRGFKSGSFQPDTYPIVALKVEQVDAFEAGFKADLLDRKLRINLSGFYYDYTNIQFNFISNGVLVVADAPGSINYGLDADVTAKPVRNLTLTAGVSLLHARYKNGFIDPYISTTGTTPSYGQQFAPGDASGTHLQDTPDFTANIGAAYDIEAGSAGKFTLAGNFFHNGGYYGDPGNQLKLAPYSLLNASLTWTEASGLLHVQVWGKNLTNTNYSQQYDMTNFGNNIVAAPPRTYGVTLGVKY